MAINMPNLDDLAYHPDNIPNDTRAQVELLAQILKFDIEPTTKRNEYTLNTLCGIILYRHLDRFQRMEVMRLILEGEPNISKADMFELQSFCTGVLVQPQWSLWSLTTKELETLFENQKSLSDLLAVLGFGFTITGVLDAYKAGKHLIKGLPFFLISAAIVYIHNEQLSNTTKELKLRTSKPRSSEYFQ